MLFFGNGKGSYLFLFVNWGFGDILFVFLDASGVDGGKGEFIGLVLYLIISIFGYVFLIL